MFAFSGIELTLLSYCPSKPKTRRLVSTMYDQADKDKTDSLPEIIWYNNNTNGGVDSLDKLVHKYSVSKKTCRWLLCVFFWYSKCCRSKYTSSRKWLRSKDKEVIQNRGTYLKSLALSLMEPYTVERLSGPTLIVVGY